MPSTATNTKKRAIAQQGTAAKRPHKDLTRTQEEIADIASNILLYGGAQQDVDLILTALARHQYMHLSFAKHAKGDDLAELYQKANEYAKIYRERWYRALCQHWPEKKDERDNKPASLSERPVTEMVRANIRESLRDRVERLLTDNNGIEAIWLLAEIVNDINNGHEPGEAIWFALDRADMYVRVPRKHKKRIEEFVAFLEKEEAA
jgi:hypothetical protein